MDRIERLSFRGFLYHRQIVYLCCSHFNCITRIHFNVWIQVVIIRLSIRNVQMIGLPLTRLLSYVYSCTNKTMNQVVKAFTTTRFSFWISFMFFITSIVVTEILDNLNEEVFRFMSINLKFSFGESVKSCRSQGFNSDAESKIIKEWFLQIKKYPLSCEVGVKVHSLW